VGPTWILTNKRGSVEKCVKECVASIIPVPSHPHFPCSYRKLLHNFLFIYRQPIRPDSHYIIKSDLLLPPLVSWKNPHCCLRKKFSWYFNLKSSKNAFIHYSWIWCFAFWFIFNCDFFPLHLIIVFRHKHHYVCFQPQAYTKIHGGTHSTKIFSLYN
jgi:hypothetical protein